MGLNILAAWTDVFVADKYLSNELWRWLALFGLLLGALVVGKIVSFVLSRQADRFETLKRGKLVSILLKSLAGPITLVLLAGAMYVAGTFLYFAETVPAEGEQKTVTYQLLTKLDIWNNVCRALAAIAAAWFLFRLVDLIEIFLHRITSRTETLLDDQLVPLIRKTLRVFVVIVAALFIAQNIFGWQIGAMLAGLGIGGLAVALAAKDTLSNLFGSVTIFSDRPFHMNDRIKVSGYDGMVEEVGFRSTRIRTLDGNQVIIPNSVIANEPVENVGRRPAIKRVLNVTVTYDTQPEKMQRGVDILREMLDTRKGQFPVDFPPQVYFSDFNDMSLNIVVYYWFTPPDWWEYLAFNHEFNMELLRRFNEEGIEFAFPTQTLYLKQDSPFSARVRSDGDGPVMGIHT